MTAVPSVRVPGLEQELRWQEGWGDVPPVADPTAWAHPGLAVGPDGSVLVGDTERPAIHRLAPDGRLLATLPVPTTEVHGLAWEERAGGPAVWVADQGVRLHVGGGEMVRSGPGAGRVVVVDLEGTVLLEPEAPRHDAYRERPYRPTFVSLDPLGDAWVADGYGGHAVHRYGRDGAYLGSLRPDPERPFDTPHAVLVDRRGPEPRVLVADRVNRRIRSFDLDGQEMGDLPAEGLTSPSGIVALGELTLVAELQASVAVLDPDGRLVGRIGQGEGPDERDGWPNARAADGSLIRPAHDAGRFAAPHAIDVAPDGAILVAEFVVGGRLVRLAPA